MKMVMDRKNKNKIRITKAKFLVNSILKFPKRLIGITKIINKKTYYPEYERKSKSEMWKDNFFWLIKNRELNTFYTSYGLDVKNLHNADDYLSNYEFTLNRTIGNQKLKYTSTGSYNYINILRDKYVFSAYLSSVLGEKYVPETIALIDGNKVFDKKKHIWTSLEAFFDGKKKVVFKTIDGECADGVELVDISDGYVAKDNSRIIWKDYIKGWNNNRILVQSIVQQHDEIAAINPYCVNTIRIVTIKGKSGAVNIFAAFLRLGADKDSFVDNRAKGGLGVGIHIESGKLMKYGYVHDAFGVKEEVHPITGFRFENYQLPFWDEVKELVCNAHKQLYALESIGWDVVISTTGPMLLEGNDDWEISGPQDTSGGLKSRWYELRNA